MLLGHEHHRSSTLSFSMYCIGVHDVNISFTDDANPDHLVRLVSAKFLYCEVTIFPFAINKYLGGKTLRLSCSLLWVLPGSGLLFFCFFSDLQI